VRGGRVLGAACAVLVLICAAPRSASAQSVSATNFQQVTADPPVVTPPTTPCTEQVIDHVFANSYYAPAFGTVTPPAACPAPWSSVVLSFSGDVGGVQFDRIADVYVGDVNVFSTSTSEPCCTPGATVSWTWTKDVSEDIPLLTSAQPVTVFLNNVNDSTYTGQYHIVVSFAFYPASAGAPAASHPDTIAAVDDMANSGGDGFFSLGASGQQGTGHVTFPRNLVKLQAELFAQGHGPCEEFWWGEPDQCGVSTPYREVDVYVDGQLAGAAPVYPVVFTGADGPGLWEPIASPRAWQLRPYLVDLSPFVGTLTNGAAHIISLGVSDVVYGSGDFWLVGANLLEWQDSGVPQVTGSLTTVSAPPAPSESSVSDPTGSGAGTIFSASHSLQYSGVVNASSSTVDTVNESISEHTTEAGVSTHSTWDWQNDAAQGDAFTNSDSTYGIDNTSPGSFQFSDANQSVIDNGVSHVNSSFTETMATVAVGLALNGAECEAVTAQNYSGHASYSRTLLAAGGNVISDQPTYTACSTATTPAAQVPEVPMTPLLLAVAALLVAGVVLRRRRAGTT
jgi:hypothetical protein